RLDDVFEEVGGIISSSYSLTDREFPEHIVAARATASAMRMTGVRPHLGRLFEKAEDRPGGPAVVVLSYELWTTHFEADPRILGRTMKLDGVPHTIIGVMPPHYRLWGGELWVPIRLDWVRADRADRTCRIVAVLRRGVSERVANARLAALSGSLATQYGA